MDETVCGAPFAWAARDPGRELFAVRGATVGDLRDDEDLRAAVSEAIDRANALVSQAETIKRFAILPGSFEVGAELTPTLKIRRKYVLDKYAGDIDALYAMPRM